MLMARHVLLHPVVLLLGLHLLLAFTPPASASEYDNGCPECCFLAPHSACCQGCLVEAVPASPSLPPPPPPASLGARQERRGHLERWSALSLPGCPCCLTQLSRGQPRSSFILQTCCSLCRQSLLEEKKEEEEAGVRPADSKRERIGEGGFASSRISSSSAIRPANALPSCLLPAIHPADVSREDVLKAWRTSRRVSKRTTSLDCMCCMNSGISDCCSKCRIF